MQLVAKMLLLAAAPQVQAEQQRVGVVAAQRRSVKAQVAEQRRRMGGTDAAVKQEQAVSHLTFYLLWCLGGSRMQHLPGTLDSCALSSLLQTSEALSGPQSSRKASECLELGIEGMSGSKAAL